MRTRTVSTLSRTRAGRASLLQGRLWPIATATSVIALAIGSGAQAQNVYSCPSPTEEFYGALPYYSVTCDPEDGGSSYTGIDGDYSEGLTLEMTVTNELNMVGNTDYQSRMVKLFSYGDDGSESEVPGVPGGDITFTNHGDLQLVSGSNSGSGAVAGIDVLSQGGTGADGSRYDNGAAGGTGNPVKVTNYGQVILNPEIAPLFPDTPVFGIRARSLGGGGGTQGDANVGDQNGGPAGAGQTSTVVNSGAISIGASGQNYTTSRNSLGITAQSYGGTGGQRNGSGGAGGAITVNNTADISMYLDVLSDFNGYIAGIDGRSIGGDGIDSIDNSNNGGNGAFASNITITHTGTITIGGDIEAANLAGSSTYSAGIYALSQGGDGGEAPSKDKNGGAGGSASNNGTSTVTLDASSGTSKVQTTGDGVMGVLLRSLGGNGGNGQGTDSKDVDGGAGGDGNDLTVHLKGAASISTDGDGAYAVVGQSVGGIGGGNAEEAGAGGSGDEVVFIADEGSSITTTQDFSGGVTLHSVGGGGGVGADFTRVLAGADGGDGGNGGDAHKAEITSAATVTTNGEHSTALLAQSVGGAGGAGGIGTSLTVSLGGNGGEGGAGGNAIINHSGTINTSGYGSMGLVAQTLSGGGGAAGMSGGSVTVGGDAGSASNNTGTANINFSGDITTTKDAATGVLAQSIGGGGGSAAGSAGVFAVGGTGAAGGNGGTGNVYDVGGTTTTSGAHAHGVQAQSIAGGGGSGGDVLDASIGLGGGVGGNSSSGGNGGSVCVSSSYSACGTGPQVSGDAPTATGSPGIATGGGHAIGVLAQSVGGGGGSGGSATGASVADVISLQIGGMASGGGHGGDVSVNYSQLTLNTAGDNAHGIVAQSVGGGGGQGGDAQSVGVLDIVPVQLGGSTGSGGYALGVDVTLDQSEVRTKGAHAVGSIAQAIGGGGGVGGSATGVDASVGFASDAAVGASGGDGGNGGYTDSSSNETSTDVTLSDTRIATGVFDNGLFDPAAVNSFGVLVQSIGGGGGKGGSSSARALAVALPDFEGESFAFTATASVGGAGGAAGAGYNVNATVDGASYIVTGGHGAHALVAQSIAHGGGAGGDASAMGGTIGDADTISATVNTAIGNSGGSGGTARDVTVHLKDTTTVYTAGDHANAIVAQSIAGGGGDGGMGSTSHNQIGGGFNMTAGIGLGGTGGSGGSAGEVIVELDAGTRVTTTGSGSRGIVAQSIAGGGGTGQGGTIGLTASAGLAGDGDGGEEAADDDGGDDGGDDDDTLTATATVNVGSTPGTGGVAQQVGISIAGTIDTAGDDADGILAQSIGGSGGLAGSVGNDAGSDNFGGDDDDTTYTLTATIGGNGGQGNNAAGVGFELTNATITTAGDYADGVVLQSIGGGGGAGGTATADGSEATAGITLGVGGQGGQGGIAGPIIATFEAGTDETASIGTAGYGAHALLMQSIGGGGQGADGSEQSSGSITVGAAVGGAGGAGGNGNDIGIGPAKDGSIAAPTLATRGDDAYALFAQSIGGGGGYGAAGTAETDDGDLSLDVTLGGSGGAAGSGGAINIGVDGSFTTQGKRSMAILLQSVGGGGGVGGATSRSNITGVSLGGKGGGAGDGGTVTLNLRNSTVRASGESAPGIVLQSIGGGGGIAGDVTNNGLGTNFGTTSDGSDGNGAGGYLQMSDNAQIHVTGNYTFGIVAQSIGGGGGMSGTSSLVVGSRHYGTTSTSGDVQIQQAGTLNASGSGSLAIFGQSDAPSTKGSVTVNVAGTVSGATGVMVAQGNSDNAVYVESTGSITGGTVGVTPTGPNASASVSDAAVAPGAVTPPGDGAAVAYRGNDGLLVDNRGRVTGDVLWQDENTGALIGTPPIIRLRNRVSGTLGGATTYHANVVNAGRMEVGNLDAVNGLHITGDFTQPASGETAMAADFNLEQSNSIRVDGAASLAGALTVHPVAAVKGRQLSFISAGDGVTGRFDSVNSQLFTFSHGAGGNGYSVTLSGETFGAASRGLDPQQQNVAGYLSELFAMGDVGMATTFGALDAAAANGTYASSLSGLAPGATLAGEAASFQTSQDRLSTLLNCTDTRTAVSTGTSCLQMLGSGRWIDQDGGSTGVGYDGRAYTVGLAGDILSESGWRFGGMAGYETSSYSGQDTADSADGGTAFAGLSASRDIGAYTLSAAAVYSRGSFDTSRVPGLTSGAARAEASHDVTSIAGRIKASYRQDYGSSYILPAMALDVIGTSADGYTETGAGSLSLTVGDSDETAVIFTPTLEAGRIYAMDRGNRLKLYGRVGASLSSIDQYQAPASFVGAPAGATPFLSSIAVPDTVGLISAGVQILGTGRMELDMRYDGAFGSGLTSQQASLNLTFRF